MSANGNFSGKVPGFDYELLQAPDFPCTVCGRSLPLMSANKHVTVCEPCAMLLAWLWRNASGIGTADIAYPLKPSFALALIVRERPNDIAHPFDVLMVERKDEPGYFGLPGGKIAPDMIALESESPADAAVRELAEETGLASWPSALELLYTGYSARSMLGSVFLVRGYHGEPEPGKNTEGQEVAWKPWPPGDHAKHMAGFYRGVAEAFDTRWRTHRQLQASTPLSLELGEPAVLYLERKLAHLGGDESRDDARMLEGFSHVMTGEERDITEIVIAAEARRRRDSLPGERTPSPDELEPGTGGQEDRRTRGGQPGPSDDAEGQLTFEDDK
jgi:ADP-ribose pyrophosphatase YjhB (NUDIX family)